MKSSAAYRLLPAAMLAVLPGILAGCGQRLDIAALCSQSQNFTRQKQAGRAEALLENVLDRLGHESTGELDRASLLVCLGNVYWQDHKPADAEAAYKEALSIDERKLGQDDISVAEPLAGLARLYEHGRRFAEAEKAARRALLILDRHLQPTDPRLEPAINSVLSVACRSGRCRDELALYGQLLRLRTSIYGPDHEYTSAARLLLAEAYAHHNNYKEAIALCRQDVESARRTHSNRLPSALDNLAHVLDVAGDAKAALPIIEEAVDIRTKQPANFFPQQIIGSLRIKGQVLIDTGRLPAAEANNSLLLERARTLYGPDNPILADFYVGLADTLAREGKSRQAQAAQAEAERLYGSKQDTN